MDIRNLAISIFIGLAAETPGSNGHYNKTLEIKAEHDNCWNQTGKSIDYDRQE